MPSTKKCIRIVLALNKELEADIRRRLQKLAPETSALHQHRLVYIPTED